MNLWRKGSSLKFISFLGRKKWLEFLKKNYLTRKKISTNHWLKCFFFSLFMLLGGSRASYYRSRAVRAAVAFCPLSVVLPRLHSWELIWKEISGVAPPRRTCFKYRELEREEKIALHPARSEPMISGLRGVCSNHYPPSVFVQMLLFKFGMRRQFDRQCLWP